MYNDFLEFNELPRETIVRFNESVLHEYVKLKPGEFRHMVIYVPVCGFWIKPIQIYVTVENGQCNVEIRHSAGGFTNNKGSNVSEYAFARTILNCYEVTNNIKQCITSHIK